MFGRKTAVNVPVLHRGHYVGLDKKRSANRFYGDSSTHVSRTQADVVSADGHFSSTSLISQQVIFICKIVIFVYCSRASFIKYKLVIFSLFTAYCFNKRKHIK